MKGCLIIAAIIGIIFGLFGVIPILVIQIPDMQTIRPGEMVVTGIKSVRRTVTYTSAIGYIKGDGRSAFFADVDKLCNYIGFCDEQLKARLSSDSSLIIPVWYTDRGRAMSRFEENSPRPDNRNIIKALKRLSFFFLPALLLLIFYGYQHWKRYYDSLVLLLPYALAAGFAAQGIHWADNLNTIGL